MKSFASALIAGSFVLLSALGPASAGSDYSFGNRVGMIFPGGSKHISPYPMSKRAAAVWKSDSCWRDCTGQMAWRFERCVRKLDPEACRDRLDYDDRVCLRSCRTRGGPLLPLMD